VKDRKTSWIQWAGQIGGIPAVGDIRDLRSSKADDLVTRVVTVGDIEIVEVAARGAKYQRAYAVHTCLLFKPDTNTA
jgi:hypothetical protein